MSADNLYAVWPTRSGAWAVAHAFASPMDEDCQYLLRIEDRGEGSRYPTRAEALVAAHDAVKNEEVVEYGVYELKAPPTEPCGACYVCVNERGIVADHIRRCDACGEPLIDMAVGTAQGWYHRRCEPPRTAA